MNSPAPASDDTPIGGYAPGFYSCLCRVCNTHFLGEKRSYQCRPCAVAAASAPASPAGPAPDDKAEIERLKRVIEADRSEVAEVLTALKKAIAGRYWLVGSRGSYAYDDDRYQREFAGALIEVEAAADGLKRLAADWSDCPTDRTVIEAARRERARKIHAK